VIGDVSDFQPGTFGSSLAVSAELEALAVLDGSCDDLFDVQAITVKIMQNNITTVIPLRIFNFNTPLVCVLMRTSLLREQRMKPKRVQPLIEPIIKPFTKYFCRKGYTTTIGAVVTIIVANLTDCEVTFRTMLSGTTDAI
jgi:hypothetical protein